jgi:hypothetical protein
MKKNLFLHLDFGLVADFLSVCICRSCFFLAEQMCFTDFKPNQEPDELVLICFFHRRLVLQSQF